MEHLMKWWSGYILVELSGYSPERLLNLCGYNGIELWELVCAEGNYRFYVRRSDFKQLVGFVRKSKTRLVILKKCGLPFWMRQRRKRWWFAAGILICGLLMYTLSLHIWEIDFDGNSYFTDELLQEALMESGYYAGMPASRIVCDDLEMMLRETYPEITWVSAQIRGTQLYIQIRENEGILTVEEVDESPSDLVAAVDGVITSIITRNGTPVVKAGDTVTAGQILVKGVVELYNDSKEKIGEHFVRADADIQAQTVIPYEDRLSMEYPVKWYTGEQRYQLAVSFWGHEFELDISELPWWQPFAVYDRVTTQKQVYLTEDLALPIRWQLTTLREYEEIRGIYSREQVIRMAEDNCAKFFANLCEKGVQIIEKNVGIDTMGNECVAQGTVTVIREIGQSVPIAQNMGDQEETNN